MSDPEMELVKAIRRSRDAVVHEFLCAACAHRDHRCCEKVCPVCGVACGCVCQRWAIPVPGV